jgi:hypothetical protein
MRSGSLREMTRKLAADMHASADSILRTASHAKAAG